jgi:hypothetical protein
MIMNSFRVSRPTRASQFLAALIISVMATVVFADSPKYKRGSPSCVDNGFTATCNGSITGLGNGNVLALSSFPNATGTTICTSPGGNDSPGQNPAAPAPVTGSASIGNPKNGNLSFSVTTAVPANPTPQAAGCPNKNWTARFDNVTFGCGTVTIQQETFEGSGIYQTVLGPTQVCL